MRRPWTDVVVRLLRPAVTAVLVLCGWLGVVVLTQQPDQAVFAAILGAAGGLTVGLATTWSQDGSVRRADLVRYPLLGVAVLVAIQGASVLGRWGTTVALVLLAGAWLLAVAGPSPRRDQTGEPNVPEPIVAEPHDAGVRPDHLDTADLSALCRLWEELRRIPPPGTGRGADAQLPDAAAAVTVRAEVLDEIERRNPTGFARWISREAPENLASYVLADSGS